MRTGRRVNNRIRDDRGLSLVELIIVITIMMIMTGLVALGISMMYSRDTNYVAVRIDDAFTEARTMAMSKEGEVTYTLHVVSEPNKSTVVINRAAGATPDVKTIALDKDVSISVKGDEDDTPMAGDFVVVFDKAKGCVKSVNGADPDKGVYTITVTSNKNPSKAKTVTLVTTTGRHYTEK